MTIKWCSLKKFKFALISALLAGFCAHAETLRPFGYSALVKDPSSGVILGSASNVRLYSNGLGFITAAHVVNKRKQVTLKLSNVFFEEVLADVMMVDSEIDLAILKVRGDSLAFLTTGLADRLTFSAGVDLDIHKGPSFLIEVEALDPIKNQPFRESVQSKIYIEKNAISGRSLLDSLLVLSYDGQPGMSGGLVMGYVNSDGTLASEKPEDPLVGARHQTIGMILGYVPGEHKLIVLPAPVISARIAPTMNIKTRIDSVTVSRGQVFESDDLIVLRPFPGNSSRQVHDTGTGRIADGSSEWKAPGWWSKISPQWESGVVFKNDLATRWLTLGDSWTQFSNVRAPQLRSGIYERDGVLYATSRRALDILWGQFNSASNDVFTRTSAKSSKQFHMDLRRERRGDAVVLTAKAKNFELVLEMNEVGNSKLLPKAMLLWNGKKHVLVADGVQRFFSNDFEVLLGADGALIVRSGSDGWKIFGPEVDQTITLDSLVEFTRLAPGLGVEL